MVCIMQATILHKLALLFLCLAQLLFPSEQISLPTDPTYYAGVVEHPPATDARSRDRTKTVMNSFLSILNSNATDDLDILVFPEIVLSNNEMATYVPDPALNITPCISPDYDIYLVELSCAARSRKLYIVLNLAEKELCSNNLGSSTLNPCPPSGIRYFNTNVVLDRQGRVISRYRKSHLWRYEYYERAVLQKPDYAIFSTDFGVTFAHFICFDMLFYEPAQRLIVDYNITDIIYPTYWFSELPFLTALQLQEGWSFANNVNLLAADASKPSSATTGSGIYAGRAGRLTAAIHEQPTQLLLKARVPKRHAITTMPTEVQPLFQPQFVTPRLTELGLFRDYNVDIFTTELLSENFTSVQRQLCHSPTDFCCNFEVNRVAIAASQEGSFVSYRYRLGAYFGSDTTFIRVDRSAQAVCAIFTCTSEELYTCGRIYPSVLNVSNAYYFSGLKVSAVFPGAPRRMIMPSTVDGAFMPLLVTQYNWTELPAATARQQPTQVSLQLTQPKNDLLTFGIWANYYTEIPTLHNLDHLQSGAQLLGSGSSAIGAGATALLPLLLLASSCVWAMLN